MIERERTFLLKYLPKDLQNFPKKEVYDLYVPTDVEHPVLRIRKVGDEMFLTKKFDVSGEDTSVREERTIQLTKHEYRGFLTVQAKKLLKFRYQYKYQGYDAELDVFQQDLFGLAMIDFEFQTQEKLLAFQMPEFCLVEVTNDHTFAGGVLAGKKYQDVKPKLEKYGYRPLLF